MADRVATLSIPIESRASVEAKALRIILERRLTILAVQKGRVIAECRGQDQIYHLGWTKGAWWCHCDNRGKSCSHLKALQHVVVRPED